MRNRYPHELSGGQRQRVGIARSLSLEPQLLVADEPTSALDVSVQARVLELFQELQQEHGFACLFISHDLAVVEMLSDRIAVMSEGDLVEIGTSAQIVSNPKDPYTQRLIAAVPVPDPDEQEQRRTTRDRLLAEAAESARLPGWCNVGHTARCGRCRIIDRSRFSARSRAGATTPRPPAVPSPKNGTSMTQRIDLRNIAIIAHVDHGKTTMVD